MESYEEWLDQNDDFDSENDQNPQRNEADEATIARILGIGTRHVRRLAREGVLTRLASGNYARMASIDSYVAHATKPSKQTVGLRDRQAALLQRRLDKEAEDSISMASALTTLDAITLDFVESIAEVGREAAKGPYRADREKIAQVIGAATKHVEAKFGEAREALRTGKRGEDE